MRTGRKIIILLLLHCTLGKEESRKLPDTLAFATATSSYQIEGAWNEDGKGENIWDYYVHTHSDKIIDGSTSDIACDSYHKTELDVDLIKNVGFQRYRFSVSWSRILPDGFSNAINEEGLKYYNGLIDKLIANGITPIVTLYHWDLPQTLQKLGGWANSLIADWFEDYARIVFDNFGDRVKLWITLNQPRQICFGYSSKLVAPGVESSGLGEYMCARNVLLAHARVFHLYKSSYQSTQGGRIGITIKYPWKEPATSSVADVEASERDRQFEFGIYAHPIYTKVGDFPRVVKESVAARSEAEGFHKSRLPSFSNEEINYIRGSADFLGMNYYTTFYTKDRIPSPIGEPSSEKDANVVNYQDPNWPPGSLHHFKSVPWGFRKVLNYVKHNYGDPEVQITENGFPDLEELNDVGSVRYYNDHLNALLDAIEVDGVNVTMYTAWSLMDNFEWTAGYTARFGLHHVDFENPDLKRTPKASARYFKELMKTKTVWKSVTL